MIEEVFERQQKILAKNHQIEIHNGGYIHAMHMQVSNRLKQNLIRDYHQRITEEVWECIDAKKHHGVEEFFEELMDLLSFATNLYIICGIDRQHVLCAGSFTEPDPHYMDIDNFQTLAYNNLNQLSEAVNMLKAKYWRKDYEPTDQVVFERAIIDWYRSLIVLIRTQMTKCNIEEQHLAKHIKVLKRISNDY